MLDRQNVGNGGILRRPAADYDELNRKAKQADKEAGSNDAD
jgi:hypothetical protein